MEFPKVVVVLHPESQVRMLLRSVLQDARRTVLTDHSWSDLLADRSSAVPSVILMDRSMLDHAGMDVLSQLRQKWSEAEIVFLPEGLLRPEATQVALSHLTRHVDRLLSMKTTRELLAV